MLNDQADERGRDPSRQIAGEILQAGPFPGGRGARERLRHGPEIRRAHAEPNADEDQNGHGDVVIDDDSDEENA